MPVEGETWKQANLPWGAYTSRRDATWKNGGARECDRGNRGLVRQIATRLPGPTSEAVTKLMILFIPLEGHRWPLDRKILLDELREFHKRRWKTGICARSLALTLSGRLHFFFFLFSIFLLLFFSFFILYYLFTEWIKSHCSNFISFTVYVIFSFTTWSIQLRINIL